jgi:hypothetical protein
MHNSQDQKELPLWPNPRWPTLGYLAEAGLAYLVAALFVGALCLMAIVVVARPLWAAIFVAGAAAGILGFRSCRRLLRRISSRVRAFPTHA